MGPALFGPDLGENEFQVAAELAQVSPQDGCVLFPGDEPFKGRIVLMMRGGCLFVQKVRQSWWGVGGGSVTQKVEKSFYCITLHVCLGCLYAYLCTCIAINFVYFLSAYL